MAKAKSTEFMFEFVQDYLDGKSERLDFDLDFNHYLIQHYPKMERENPYIADCFSFYLSEEGQDRSEGLSDAEHKKLIRRQFKEFKSALRDGI
jgi:hypothetical protein